MRGRRSRADADVAADVEIPCQIYIAIRERKTVCPSVAIFKLPAPADKIPLPASPEKLREGGTSRALRQRDPALRSIVAIDVDDEIRILAGIHIHRTAGSGRDDSGIGNNRPDKSGAFASTNSTTVADPTLGNPHV